MIRIIRLGFALAATGAFLFLSSSPSLAEGAPAAPSPATATSDAVATPSIETLHAALLDLMKNADSLGYQGRFDRIRPVVEQVFDMEFMASKSIGRHWKKLSPDDQARWLELFTRHIAANYAGQFTGFGGEAFETVGEEDASRGTRVVLTKLTRPSDEDVQLNYRLRDAGGEWKIIDIYLNGTVSELALRRSEYASVLKREGFESLVSTITEKCQKLEDEGSTG